MEWLKEARVKKHMTGAQVATESGVTQQFYNYIEHGERRPSVETAKKIAAVLDFPWVRFFE